MNKLLLTAALLFPLVLTGVSAPPVMAQDAPSKKAPAKPEAEKKADEVPAHKKSRIGKSIAELQGMSLGDDIIISSDLSYVMEKPTSAKDGEGKKEAPTTGKTAEKKEDAKDGAKDGAKEGKDGDASGESKTNDGAKAKADPNDRRKLDLYLPKDKKDFPIFIFVHGGSWTNEFGDKLHGKAIATGLCELGIGVVSIGYRAASLTKPEESQRYPKFVEEVAMGVAWVHKNIKSHGGDPSKIVIGGHSAGAQIAGLLAYDPSYLKAWNLDNQKVFKGFVSISGACIIPSIEHENEQVAMFAPMFDMAFDQDKETRDQASVTTHIAKGDCQSLVLYAAMDFPHMDLIAKEVQAKSKELGVACTTNQIDGRMHDSILQEFGTVNDKTTELVANFVKEAFGMQDPAKKVEPAKDSSSESKADK